MSKHLHQFNALSASLHPTIDPRAVQAAALLITGRRLFGRYGVTHSIDLDPTISLLHTCVAAWCEAEHIAEEDVDTALVVLNDATLRMDMAADYASLLS